MTARDGRMFEPVLVVRSERDGDRFILRAPAVGLWRHAPTPGTMIRPGAALGELEILGKLHRLQAPDDAYGVVTDEVDLPAIAPIPVDHRTVLARLDPTAAVSEQAAVEAATHGPTEGLVFRAPLSGRFYARPSPDKPPFVEVGDEVSFGQTIALLEVMKTFNRITYGGSGLPTAAKIKAILAKDESDVDEGTPLFELEPV